MHVDIGQGSRGERYEKSQVKEGGEGRKRRRGGGGGGRDTTGKRNLRDRRCRDTAGRAVNYKRKLQAPNRYGLLSVAQGCLDV